MLNRCIFLTPLRPTSITPVILTVMVKDEFIALSDNPHRADRAHVLMQTEASGQLNVHQSPGEEAVWAKQQSSRLIIADYNNDGRDDIFAVARKANDPHWLVLSSDKGRFSYSRSANPPPPDQSRLG